MKKRVLITGATGFIGSHLLNFFLFEDYEVYALKRSSSMIENTKEVFSYYFDDHLKFKEIKWLDADILDFDKLSLAIEKIDIVIHSAAIVSFNSSDKWEMIEVNKSGTANIVDACLVNKVEKLVHISSVATFGNDTKANTIDEDSPRSPKQKSSAYSLSKYYAELEVWRGIAEGLNAVMVNPSVVLGEGFWDNGSSIAFNQVEKGLYFYPGGKTGFVDVKDVCKAVLLVLENDVSAERFCVTSQNLSFKEIFTLIADSLSKTPPKIYIGKIISSAFWRFEKIRSMISRKIPLLTQDSARSAQSISLFSSEKFVNKFNYEFTPISETIIRISKAFVKHKLR